MYSEHFLAQVSPFMKTGLPPNGTSDGFTDRPMGILVLGLSVNSHRRAFGDRPTCKKDGPIVIVILAFSFFLFISFPIIQVLFPSFKCSSRFSCHSSVLSVIPVFFPSFQCFSRHSNAFPVIPVLFPSFQCLTLESPNR